MTTYSSKLDFGNIRRRKAKSRSSIIHLKHDTKSLDNDTDSCDEAIDVTNYDEEPMSPPEVFLNIFDLLSLHSDFSGKENVENFSYDPDPGYGSASSTSAYESSHSSFRVTDTAPLVNHDLLRPSSPTVKPECQPVKRPSLRKSSYIPKRIDDLLDLGRVLKKSLVISCEKLDLDDFCRKNRFVRSHSDTVLMVPQPLPSETNIERDKLDSSTNINSQLSNSTNVLNVISNLNHEIDAVCSTTSLLNKPVKVKPKVNNHLKPVVWFSDSVPGPQSKSVMYNNKPSVKSVYTPHKVVLNQRPNIIAKPSLLNYSNVNVTKMLQESNPNSLLIPKISQDQNILDDVNVSNLVSTLTKQDISAILPNTVFSHPDDEIKLLYQTLVEKCDNSKPITNINIASDSVNSTHLYSKIEIIPKYEEPKEIETMNLNIEEMKQNIVDPSTEYEDDLFGEDCDYVSSDESDINVSFDIRKEMESVMMGAKSTNPPQKPINTEGRGSIHVNKTDNHQVVKKSVPSSNFSCSRYNAELDNLLFGSSFGGFNFFEEVEVEKPVIVDSSSTNKYAIKELERNTAVLDIHRKSKAELKRETKAEIEKKALEKARKESNKMERKTKAELDSKAKLERKVKPELERKVKAELEEEAIEAVLSKSTYHNLKKHNSRLLAETSKGLKDLSTVEVVSKQENVIPSKKITLKIGRQVRENKTSFSILRVDSNSDFEGKEALDSESDTKPSTHKRYDIPKQAFKVKKSNANKLSTEKVTPLTTKSRRGRFKSELNVDPNNTNALQSAFNFRSHVTELAADVDKKSVSSLKLKTERRKGKRLTHHLKVRLSKTKPLFINTAKSTTKKKALLRSLWRKKKTRYKRKSKMSSKDLLKGKSETLKTISIKADTDLVAVDNSASSMQKNMAKANSNGINDKFDSVEMTSTSKDSPAHSSNGETTVESLDSTQVKSDMSSEKTEQPGKMEIETTLQHNDFKDDNLTSDLCTNEKDTGKIEKDSQKDLADRDVLSIDETSKVSSVCDNTEESSKVNSDKLENTNISPALEGEISSWLNESVYDGNSEESVIPTEKETSDEKAAEVTDSELKLTDDVQEVRKRGMKPKENRKVEHAKRMKVSEKESSLSIDVEKHQGEKTTEVLPESTSMKRTPRNKVPKKMYSPEGDEKQPRKSLSKSIEKETKNKKEDKPIKNGENHSTPTTTTPKQKLKYDPNEVTKPFLKGWMREVVHRAVTSSAKTNRGVDIYYFTPEGTKLRSMPDISKYLSDHKSCDLTMVNFTFCKEPVYRHPFETVRGARVRLPDGTSPVTPIDNKLSQKLEPKPANKNKTNVSPKPAKSANKAQSLSNNSTPKPASEKSEDGIKLTLKTARKSMKVSTSVPSVHKKNDSDVVNSQSKATVESTVPSSGEDIEHDVQQLRDSSSSTDKKVRRPTKRLFGENTDTKSTKKPKRTQVLPSPCTSRCSIALYQVPTLQCTTCLCMFHRQCVVVKKDQDFVCKACIIKTKAVAPGSDQLEEGFADSISLPFVLPEISLQLTPDNYSKKSSESLVRLPPPPPLQRAPERCVPTPMTKSAFQVTVTPIRPTPGTAIRSIAFQPRPGVAKPGLGFPAPLMSLSSLAQSVMPTPLQTAVRSIPPRTIYSSTVKSSFNRSPTAGPCSRFVILQQPGVRSSSISIVPQQPGPYNIGVPGYPVCTTAASGIGNLTVRVVLPSSIPASDVMRPPPIMCSSESVAQNTPVRSMLEKQLDGEKKISESNPSLNKLSSPVTYSRLQQPDNTVVTTTVSVLRQQLCSPSNFTMTSEIPTTCTYSTTTANNPNSSTTNSTGNLSTTTSKSNSDADSTTTTSGSSTAEVASVKVPPLKQSDSSSDSDVNCVDSSSLASNDDDSSRGHSKIPSGMKRSKNKKKKGKGSDSAKKRVVRRQQHIYTSTDSSDDSVSILSNESPQTCSKAVSCDIVSSYRYPAFPKDVNLNSFTIGYECLNKIFKELPINDLLKAAQVNRSWQHLASQGFLWRKLSFNNLYIKDWVRCSEALKKHGTRSLNMRGMLIEDFENDWKNFSNGLNNLGSIEFMSFGQVPPSVVEAVVDKLPLLQNLECYCVTKIIKRPDLWTTPCKIKFFNFRFLRKLKKLKIRSSGGLQVEQEPTEIRYLTDLQHLSMTSLKEFPGSHFGFIAHMPNLLTLELGDCSLWTEENYTALSKLTKLQQLRLENGGGFDVGIANALSKLTDLKELELMKFIMPADLGSCLKDLTGLSTVGFWPDNSDESLTAKINFNTLQSAEQLKQVSYFCWGIISPDDCIPLLPILNESGKDNEEMNYEDLFQRLCSSLPDAKVEMKCISEDFLNEYCYIQRSK